ncbi:MAG: hypothetical protein ACFB16_18935 [Phormidesmis sp.]
MLNSSHYLLGGLLAGSCALGALLQTSVTESAYQPHRTIESSVSKTVEVAHRGSGRLNRESTPNDLNNSSAQNSLYVENADINGTSMEMSDSELAESNGASNSSTSGGKDLVSHRGSGRVRPSLL